MAQLGQRNGGRCMFQVLDSESVMCRVKAECLIVYASRSESVKLLEWEATRIYWTSSLSSGLQVYSTGRSVSVRAQHVRRETARVRPE